MTSVVTTEWRVFNAEKFIESLTQDENYFYMWAGQFLPVTVTPLISTDTIDSSVDIYSNMIFGKQIQNTDTALVFRNIPYTSNTVYSAYDDGDPVLLEKDFYVIIDGGQGYYKHVFKCLDNNNGSISTVVPNFNNLSASDDTYTTSDGYIWKYMFSVDQTNYTKFATPTGMVPVIANTAVSDLAVAGAIDIISISNTGVGYNNYLLGTFGAFDCRFNGNTVTYSVSANNISYPLNGFYTGCLLYISSGPGIGQSKLVTDYIANTSGNYIVVDSEFIVPPMSGSTYEIYPNVVIIGDGNQSVNATARAMVNAVGNTIYHVEMLNKGAGYTSMTATVTANSVVPVTQNAVIRPVYSPAGGHGSNPAVELGAVSVCVSTAFRNNESNTIPTTNGYRQVGILRDPLFANVVITTSNTTGNFIPGETLNSVELLPIGVTASISSNSISGVNSYFTTQMNIGDYLYVQSYDGLFQSLIQVQQISSNTNLAFTPTISWACTSISVAKAEVVSSCTIRSFEGATAITLDQVSPSLTSNTFIIGSMSGASGTISSITRNGSPKSFNTFVQMMSFVGNIQSGQFIQNETIYQGNIGSNNYVYATLHSVVTGATSMMYCVNSVGLFNPSLTVYGATSGASFTFSTIYFGEITPRSGDIIYAENISMINRANTSSEYIAAVLDF